MSRRLRANAIEAPIALVALAVLGGCSARVTDRGVEPAWTSASATNVAAPRAQADRGDPEIAELPAGPLDVDQAVRFAAAHHPEVAAARARLEAATGRVVQAGLFPNPTFSAYAESAPFSGKTTGEAEYPIGITQPLPLGGRLGTATRVAEARSVTLHFEYWQKVRELERRVRGAFAAALFAKQALAVEEEIAGAAAQTAAVARQRVEAGDASPDEQARAELEAARARMSVSEAELLRDLSLLELQAALRVTGRAIDIQGELEAVLALPELESVIESLAETPALRVRDAMIHESEARVLHEEASRVPDLDIGFFYRRVEETSTNAFDVGIAIELPLFDRRQGSLREAHAGVVESRALRRSAEIDLATRVRAIHQRLRRGLEKARLFREEVSARSRTVLEAAEARYRAGETSLAELIPIRRDHRELERAYLGLLRQIALDWSEFRSLVAGPDGGES